MITRRIEYVNKALKIDPKDSAALNNLGQVLVSDRQLDKGIECFQRALKLDTNNSYTIFSTNIDQIIEDGLLQVPS